MMVLSSCGFHVLVLLVADDVDGTLTAAVGAAMMSRALSASTSISQLSNALIMAVLQSLSVRCSFLLHSFCTAEQEWSMMYKYRLHCYKETRHKPHTLAQTFGHFLGCEACCNQRCRGWLYLNLWVGVPLWIHTYCAIPALSYKVLNEGDEMTDWPQRRFSVIPNVNIPIKT